MNNAHVLCFDIVNCLTVTIIVLIIPIRATRISSSLKHCKADKLIIYKVEPMTSDSLLLNLPKF